PDQPYGAAGGAAAGAGPAASGVPEVASRELLQGLVLSESPRSPLWSAGGRGRGGAVRVLAVPAPTDRLLGLVSRSQTWSPSAERVVGAAGVALLGPRRALSRGRG